MKTRILTIVSFFFLLGALVMAYAIAHDQAQQIEQLRNENASLKQYIKSCPEIVQPEDLERRI